LNFVNKIKYSFVNSITNKRGNYSFVKLKNDFSEFPDDVHFIFDSIFP
jgi:hypothetical protein